MISEETLKEQLRRDHPEFRKLFEEHHRLDLRVQKLTRRKVLTPQEELERKMFQIEKLHAKDRMEAILRQYRQPAEPSKGT
jgi:uncharacterized protein YdcH (DUF465 family)